jgi:hypothetical protein
MSLSLSLQLNIFLFKDSNQILPKRYVGMMNHSFKTRYGINLGQGLDHELKDLSQKKIKNNNKTKLF